MSRNNSAWPAQRHPGAIRSPTELTADHEIQQSNTKRPLELRRHWRYTQICCPATKAPKQHQAETAATSRHRIYRRQPRLDERSPPLRKRKPRWRNGRRCGLKIRFPQGSGGSNPFLGTPHPARLVVADQPIDSQLDSHRTLTRLRPFQERPNLARRFSLRGGEDVRVCVHRQNDCRVPQRLHDYPRMDILSKEQARTCVAQVVKSLPA